MAHDELLKEYLDRLAEARVYLDQGLVDEAGGYYGAILSEIESSPLSKREKEDLRRHIEAGAGDLAMGPAPVQDRPPAGTDDDPAGHFGYGLALMDGRFWEEAIAEFTVAAELGYQALNCRELCGDCAAEMEKWDEAIGFYNLLFLDPNAPDALRKKALFKINKCSQTQKKIEVTSILQDRNGPAAERADSSRPEIISSSVSSLDGYSVNSVLGQTICSWRSSGLNGPHGEEARSYRIAHLLHVGSSSLVTELAGQDCGPTLAGQNLTGRFGELLSPEKLSAWVCNQSAVDSRHLVRVFDLAHANGHFFIVREYHPLSLCDILSAGEPIPIPLAVRFAYQLLEALGDIHLHIGTDGKPQNSFHLDLRPSRVLVRADQPCIKVCNWGLWRELERSDPEGAAPRNLPLHYLPYRAPEQFRPYLARKRPPVFTDIYQFGTIFYEILTGIPAFKASSPEEYEIQHCEQYPSPPKVWRAEIPDLLNEMVMQCLQSDPMKRFRSTTQMSLILEKSFSEALARPRDDSYRRFLEKLKLL